MGVDGAKRGALLGVTGNLETRVGWGWMCLAWDAWGGVGLGGVVVGVVATARGRRVGGRVGIRGCGLAGSDLVVWA